MEVVIAILGSILGLFLYNKFTKTNTLNANDGVREKLDDLSKSIANIEKEKIKEEAKRESIKDGIERDSKDVSSDELVDFFNNRKPK